MKTPRFSCRCRISEVRAQAYTAAESKAYIERQASYLLTAMAALLAVLFLLHASEPAPAPAPTATTLTR
jgi:hypothetical protein